MKDYLAVELSDFALYPERKHPTDAGADLKSSTDVELKPFTPTTISTGVKAELPESTMGFIGGRSSLAAKGITPLGGIIDADYRGEIKVTLINLSNETYHISELERIAQLIIIPIKVPEVVVVSEVETSTLRADKGYGSTGTH